MRHERGGEVVREVQREKLVATSPSLTADKEGIVGGSATENSVPFQKEATCMYVPAEMYAGVPRLSENATP